MAKTNESRFKGVAAALTAGVMGLGLMSSGPVQAAEPFNIDVVLALSGGGSFLGQAEQKSLQQLEPILTANGGIAGRPVHFTFYDDQSSPQTAVQVATQIKSKNPAVMLGSTLVADCGAMAPLMAKGPVMYCVSPGLYPKEGGFVYSTSNSTHDLASAMVRYYGMTGRKKIALITSTDASGTDAAKQVKAAIEANKSAGVELVGEATFNPSDVSAAAQMQRLKSAGPQALIAWSTGAAIGTVFKAVVDAGLDIPVATTNGNQTFAQMHQYAAILPKTLYIPTSQWPKSNEPVPQGVADAKKAFYDAYEKAGVKPDFASTAAWDPALVLVSALNKLGPDATAEQVRDYLSKLKGFAGIDGIYDYTKVPQRGLDEANVVVTQWDKTADNWLVVSKPRGIPLDK